MCNQEWKEQACLVLNIDCIRLKKDCKLCHYEIGNLKYKIVLKVDTGP